MEGTLENTRREWEEGNRRLQAAASADRTLYERLLAEVDLVLEQLRRRVGQTFTLRRARLGLRRVRPLGAGGDDRGRARAGLARAHDDRPGRRLPPLLARRDRLQAVSAVPAAAQEELDPPPRRSGLVLLVLVFAVGIALGQALEDNPQPGSTITQDQTLTLPPESATVTVTAP